MNALHLTIPTSWAKLSEPQALFLSNLLLEDISETELLTRCFCRFTGIRILQKKAIAAHFWFKSKQGKHLINADAFTDMLTRLDWVKEEVKLFKNPTKIGSYPACNHKLYGISLEEYLVADQMYLAYSKTKKIEFLNKLVAICYRKKCDGWNEGAKLSQWTRRFRFTSLVKKYLVYLWFTGVKAFIIELYPYIFQGDGSASTSSPSPAESVLSVLSTLSAGDISKYETIKKADVHEALHMLNLKCKV